MAARTRVPVPLLGRRSGCNSVAAGAAGSVSRSWGRLGVAVGAAGAGAGRPAAAAAAAAAAAQRAAGRVRSVCAGEDPAAGHAAGSKGSSPCPARENHMINAMLYLSKVNVLLGLFLESPASRSLFPFPSGRLVAPAGPS